ncbi:MAG: hypothetical protein A2991_00290 [Candidatus Terrybacteria bacterium RIFCSPLOWO2_01_FULL_58_14]|uniref:Prephenate/arogenate dehydrogenase domain-containing protein n=2 Tax=Candidatus Terryibacteriota TaxID=1817920 RepID=A0A1G2PWQ4_9BACT|nr:MAG: hypothetical protein A2682_00300 [Candidatus Terrybacteria bacterium RIFCSPHIGHO2_01_FULL_58_15]OHA52750.1 MAG: hypothetical protein A2991_00290 [Candidatus Terrybacteria bacterium RIFCSPLOWO2_01_FULL_58_14]
MVYTKPLIGIIGSKGKYGRFLKRLFLAYGCEVIGADAQDGPNVDERNRAVVEQANVVIFSVPPRVVEGVIKALIAHSRPEQLWMDVTSIKVIPVSAMLTSRAEVVGLHPMRAPGESLAGHVVAVCPERLDLWKSWTADFLAWTGARLKFCTPEEHDRKMAVVQGLVHAMQLTMAATIRSLDEDVHETLSFTSPVYRIALSLIGRILQQNADLYADIQMLNPHVPQVLSQAETELHRLRETVIAQNHELFVQQFVASREHFGSEDLNDAFALFEELNQLLAARSSERQVCLQTREDRPALLRDITDLFAEGDINLTHIHSFEAAQGHRFLVGLDRPREDPAVQAALARIAERGLASEME